MDPQHLLEANLALIDRLAGHVCRRFGMNGSDVDDVASMVKLRLMENDYAILRRYEGRSSLATYLTVIIQRLLSDQRERTHGRQSRTPREVPLAEEEAIPLAASDRADEAAFDNELRELSRRGGALIRETMAGWPADARLLVRLRFESSLSIADIARLMKVPQRPLYRRLESLLRRLRDVLIEGGIDSASADDLLEAAHRIEPNFNLAWKTDDAPPTNEIRGRSYSEEQS